MRFKVGDKVTVRSWGAMEREFGVFDCGDIKAKLGFTKEMRKYCGMVTKVTEIRKDTYSLGKCGTWNFTDDMLEPHSFEYGDEIEVSDNEDFKYKVTKVFVGYIDGRKLPFNVTNEDKFNSAKEFDAVPYRYARPVQNKIIAIIDGEEYEITQEQFDCIKGRK